MSRRDEVYAIFKGRTCHCGKEKQARQAFCRKCYFSLPHAMQNAIYRALNWEEQFDDVYCQCCEFLDGLPR